MESRFTVGPVGAGSTHGSFPGEPLVAMPLSLSLSPNADRIISESCYCLRGEIVGDVTSRDVPEAPRARVCVGVSRFDAICRVVEIRQSLCGQSSTRGPAQVLLMGAEPIVHRWLMVPTY